MNSLRPRETLEVHGAARTLLFTHELGRPTALAVDANPFVDCVLALLQLSANNPRTHLYFIIHD